MLSKYSVLIYFIFTVFILHICSCAASQRTVDAYYKVNKIHFTERPDLIDFYTNKYGDRIFIHTMFEEDYFVDEKQIVNGINKNIADTVFILPAISFPYDDSYYFYDTSLPRITTESTCCHPKYLATIEDIDEDGFNEVVIFYSACSSRFKSLKVMSLQNDAWIEIGGSDFDILTKDFDDVILSDLVRKTKKNEFKICNFYEGETYWKLINIE